MTGKDEYLRRPVVLLDMDNTVLDFDIAERTAISGAFAELGIPCNEAVLRRYSEINIHYWELMERGIIDRHEVLVGRFRELFTEMGVECDAEAVQENYEDRLCRGHWFMPGAEDMLEKLHKSCRLFICSNGNIRVQNGRIESAGITPYFEKMFVSESMGCGKPTKEFFGLCFSQIEGFERDNCIIIGDSLTSDIQGGINAGIKTCWYNPKGKPINEHIKPDYMISSLDDAASLIESIFPGIKD